MLLKRGQYKHLKTDGENKFKFVGQNIATDEEKKELIKFDESYINVYGYHVITNYEDLKK